MAFCTKPLAWLTSFFLGTMLFLTSGLAPVRVVHAADSPKVLSQFAFGSCNFQRANQSYWNTIAAKKPQLWVWGGDIIYADILGSQDREIEYNALKKNPHYKKFRQSIPVVGTWDDHEYGYNNVGKYYPGKAISQRMLLDFLDEPQDSPRRRQEGIYTSYTYGPIGQQAKVILLDERYFREAPGPECDLLGNTQWAWLESEMIGTRSDLLIIMSSSQIFSADLQGETWNQCPRSKERMIALLDRVSAPVLVLSGDRHFAEYTRYETPGKKTIYEFTSSGLTHSNPAGKTTPNANRVGPQLVDKNFGIVKIGWRTQSIELNLETYKINGELFSSYPVIYRRK